MMLLAKALSRVLQAHQQLKLGNTLVELLDDLDRILLHLLKQTLNLQAPDGSWGSDAGVEGSAYALILFKTLANSSVGQSLHRDVTTAIRRGEAFLRQKCVESLPTQYFWISKVTYGSQLLTRGYVLAALAPWEPKIPNEPKLSTSEPSDWFKSYGTLASS